MAMVMSEIMHAYGLYWKPDSLVLLNPSSPVGIDDFRLDGPWSKVCECVLSLHSDYKGFPIGDVYFIVQEHCTSFLPLIFYNLSSLSRLWIIVFVPNVLIYGLNCC